jgi:hypothetical protein
MVGHQSPVSLLYCSVLNHFVLADHIFMPGAAEAAAITNPVIMTSIKTNPLK